MSIKDFEKQDQILQLRKRVIRAEQERLGGTETISVSDARKQLRERMDRV